MVYPGDRVTIDGNEVELTCNDGEQESITVAITDTFEIKNNHVHHLWLAEENLEWPGNYKVRYWDKDWHNVIYGKDDSYLDKVVDTQFDGVYLDIIDAFEYFEGQ